MTLHVFRHIKANELDAERGGKLLCHFRLANAGRAGKQIAANRLFRMSTRTLGRYRWTPLGFETGAAVLNQRRDRGGLESAEPGSGARPWSAASAPRPPDLVTPYGAVRTTRGRRRRRAPVRGLAIPMVA